MHPNIIGHTGGGLSIGGEYTIVSLTKKKWNTQSLIETEVVEVDYFMPDMLCTIYWLESQGFNVFDTFSFKTIKVPFFWIRTARLLAARARNT